LARQKIHPSFIDHNFLAYISALDAPMDPNARPASFRVKQEAIEESLFLLQEPTINHAPSSFVQLDPPPLMSSTSLIISNATPATHSPPPLIKQEPNIEDDAAFKTRWQGLQLWLLQVWNATPALPSSKSRRAWASAHGIPPAYVNGWFTYRNRIAGKKGLGSHPMQGYELDPEEPRQDVADAVQSLSNEGSGSASGIAPQVEISLPPSSPPATPRDLEQTFMPVKIAGSSSPASVGTLPPLKVKNSPKLQVPAVSLAPCTSVSQAEPGLVTTAGACMRIIGVLGALLILSAVGSTVSAPVVKRGRKRKAAKDGETTSVQEPAQPKANGKRRKVVKIKIETGMSKSPILCLD
jgi:hypothetical protein